MLTIKQIKNNIRYRKIIRLLEIAPKYHSFKNGLELKHFLIFFNERHITLMKDWLGNEEYKLPKDEKKVFSKEIKKLSGGFDKASDVYVYLKRLYPYVRTVPRTKPSKYYLSNFYRVEVLKYAVFEILKDVKKPEILNIKTFKEDKAVKIDMDGISISVPIEKLDFD